MESVELVFAWLVENFVMALIFLLVGLLQIRSMLKSDESFDTSILQPLIRGWGVGLLFLFGGLMLLIENIKSVLRL
jgi:hypothetical protein